MKVAHPSAEQQPRPWTEALESQAPGCGTGAGRADSYSRSCCGARLSPGLLCPPTEARPWASCTRDPLLGPPGSGEVSGPELGVREASARAGPLVPRPRLNGGVMFQQGGVSQLCVDAVACASDELAAANLPPSKRRKEDAAWVEVADMLPADPEQVCAHTGGTQPLARTPRLRAISTPTGGHLGRSPGPRLLGGGAVPPGFGSPD